MELVQAVLLPNKKESAQKESQGDESLQGTFCSIPKWWEGATPVQCPQGAAATHGKHAMPMGQNRPNVLASCTGTEFSRIDNYY